jgi:zinc transport system ATP-binding protein
VNASALLELENVHFAYDRRTILEGVSLLISKGEFACVVGPNGGGKTTLLKLLLGQLKPNNGKVRVLGMEPEQARGRVGYLPQSPVHDLKFPIDVLRVVLMGRLGINRSWSHYSDGDYSIAHRVLQQVDMEDMAAAPFSKLSGGQRQRVLIARALAGESELLILDEPTAHLDPEAETRFFELLHGINQTATIFLVSHNPSLVSRWVSTVVCVNRKVALHPTEEITSDHLRELYGGDMRLVQHHHHQPPGRRDNP